MRRRPQPNPRRGILRAAIVVVILVLIAIGIVMVVSSLTAPPAKAPTVPPTVGPLPTPARKATPAPTRTKKGALGGSSSFAEAAWPAAARPLPAPLGAGIPASATAAASPNGRYIAAFPPPGRASSHSPLRLLDRRTGRSWTTDRADAFVRPVWSPDSRSLLYVRVAATHAYPGARWSLVRMAISSGRSQVLTNTNAMTMLPAGWSGRQVLYLVGNTTDTSLYALNGHRSSYLAIAAPQPVSFASLSPDGRFLAVPTPANCAYCSLQIYDLGQAFTWSEPVGMPNEGAMTWTRDGRNLIVLTGKSLLEINGPAESVSARFALPHALPTVWPHTMRAVVADGRLELSDTVTRQTWRAAAL